MQHESRVGLKSMEVDHFDPTLPPGRQHDYENLFLATRHCNNAKRAWWPTREQMRKGMRYLNCCKELDYGGVIFEDPATHRLIGTTIAARYHIRMCDLNAPHFIRERAHRAALWRILTKDRAIIKDFAKAMELLNLLQVLGDIADRMIPPIPASQ